MAIKPLSAKEVELIANTKNVDSNRIARFTVHWYRDHADWVGLIRQGKDRDPNKSYVDERTIPQCAQLPTGKKVSGNETKQKWPVVWSRDDVVSVKTDMEIYAVIRAEYRFIKDNGWLKLHAKRNVQGFDNLFKKGSGNSVEYAIVESKCFIHRDKYDDYVKPQDPNSPLGKLKDPTGMDPSGAPLTADGCTQMSAAWIAHALNQEAQAKGRTTAKRNLKDLADWMKQGRMPLRFLNVYAPPADGFYLIAGDYKVRSVVGSLANPQKVDNENDGNQPARGPLQVDWSDEKYRPLEFFGLDRRTCKYTKIGKFHKFWRQFRDFCRRDGLDADEQAAMLQDARSNLRG
jgi:hypothetical protein